MAGESTPAAPGADAAQRVGVGCVVGVDFTSRPTARKPIVVALGRLDAQAVRLEALHTHNSFEGFSGWLKAPGDWVGAFDLPFGLPRELVTTLGWPTEWLPLMRHYAALSREQIRDTFAAFCDARPAGGKFAHRACDKPAGSSPSMKWVNPPVAYMLHAGVPLLIDAGVHLPGLHPGDRWCVCAARWQEALAAGVPAPVSLAATHARSLEVVPLALLKQHATA
jgi:hypothetical protein